MTFRAWTASSVILLCSSASARNDRSVFDVSRSLKNTAIATGTNCKYAGEARLVVYSNDKVCSGRVITVCQAAIECSKAPSTKAVCMTDETGHCPSDPNECLSGSLSMKTLARSPFAAADRGSKTAAPEVPGIGR